MLVTNSKRSSNSNAPKREEPDYTILGSTDFKNSILADEPFTKLLQILESCVSAKNNSCGKLVSSLKLPITSDGKFNVMSVP